MHYIVSFESDYFDLAAEEPNPINPIHGKSIGLWMSPLLESEGVEVTDIDAEDWGWYLGAKFEGRDYLVGFVGLTDEEEGGTPELIVQVDKQRSVLEHLMLREKMTESDGLLNLVAGFVRGLKDARNVEIRRVG